MFPSTVVISIGRNKAGTVVPISVSEWNQYRRLVIFAVKEVGEIVFTGHGFGSDTTANGTEESYTVIVAVRRSAGREDFEAMEDSLADAAKAAGQDSVAVTYGTTKFVEGGN